MKLRDFEKPDRVASKRTRFVGGNGIFGFVAQAPKMLTIPKTRASTGEIAHSFGNPKSGLHRGPGIGFGEQRKSSGFISSERTQKGLILPSIFFRVRRRIAPRARDGRRALVVKCIGTGAPYFRSGSEYFRFRAICRHGVNIHLIARESRHSPMPKDSLRY